MATNQVPFENVIFYYKTGGKMAFLSKMWAQKWSKAIYIYIYVLWSYYLGHVWGFLIVTNWATFVF